MKVVPIAFEELVRLNAACDDEITGSCPAQARLAKPADTQLLRVADTGRNLHGDTLAVGNTTLAFAFGAWIVDGMTRSAAALAGGRGAHVAEERALNGDDATRAMTFGAGDFLATFSKSGAIAVVAGRQAVVHDFLLGARRNFLKGQAQADAHVAAFTTCCGVTAHSIEERAEDIAHTAESATEDVVEVDVAATVGFAPLAAPGMVPNRS